MVEWKDITNIDIQFVVCAANRNRTTGLIVCGARHFDDVMRAQINALTGDTFEGWRDAEQGFIDQWGNFLTREQAHSIVLRQKQCNPQLDGILFSEDLY